MEEEDIDNNEENEDNDMPKVRGHLRCIRNARGRCIRRVRVRPHRRRLRTTRRRLYR